MDCGVTPSMIKSFDLENKCSETSCQHDCKIVLKSGNEAMGSLTGAEILTIIQANTDLDNWSVLYEHVWKYLTPPVLPFSSDEIARYSQHVGYEIMKNSFETVDEAIFENIIKGIREGEKGVTGWLFLDDLLSREDLDVWIDSEQGKALFVGTMSRWFGYTLWNSGLNVEQVIQGIRQAWRQMKGLSQNTELSLTVEKYNAMRDRILSIQKEQQKFYEKNAAEILTRLFSSTVVNQG